MVKQSISGAWYLAFFVTGILLGLLVLQLLDGRDPLQGLLPLSADKPVEPAASSVDSRREASTKPQRRSTRVASPPAAQGQQAAPVPPAPMKEAAKGTAAPQVVTPAVSTARHEPILCNHKQAGEVREKAREVTEITNYGDRLSVKLRGEWAYYSDNVRRSFVKKFADSDACLNGQSRPIEFFYQGKRFASSDPDKGLRFE